MGLQQRDFWCKRPRRTREGLFRLMCAEQRTHDKFRSSWFNSVVQLKGEFRMSQIIVVITCPLRNRVVLPVTFAGHFAQRSDKISRFWKQYVILFRCDGYQVLLWPPVSTASAHVECLLLLWETHKPNSDGYRMYPFWGAKVDSTLLGKLCCSDGDSVQSSLDKYMIFIWTPLCLGFWETMFWRNIINLYRMQTVLQHS